MHHKPQVPGYADLSRLLMVGCALSFLPAHIAAADDNSKVFEEIHVVKMPKREAGYRSMVGDVFPLSDGRLLLAYKSFGGHGVAAGAIGATTSEDKGRTWSKPFTLIPKPVRNPSDEYAHPSFLRLDNGQILMSYVYDTLTKPRSSHSYFRISVDETKSWSDQYVLTRSSGVNLVHNDKLLRLSDGRLIAPAEHELQEQGGDHRGFVSRVFYSDDQGKSWWPSENTVNVLPIEAQEPHVVELKDKRLMMLCRTYSGFVVRSYSDDRGLTWSKGESLHELKLSVNSSALNLDRIPSTGDLVLLRCTGGERGKYRRTPFLSAISKDEGRSWVQERVIAGDPNDDYGYPSLTFLDEVALISYHKRDGLYVAHIPVGWFYGK